MKNVFFRSKNGAKSKLVKSVDDDDDCWIYFIKNDFADYLIIVHGIHVGRMPISRI